jgi:hypothetical protein
MAISRPSESAWPNHKRKVTRSGSRKPRHDSPRCNFLFLLAAFLFQNKVGEPTRTKTKRMKRPTVKQLRDYANAIKFFDFDPQKFLDRYDATGWKYGSTKITNWMACVRTWKRTATRDKPRPPKIPYRLRESRINFLNRRKAQLLRLRQTPEVERELERIQTQLHKL